MMSKRAGVVAVLASSWVIGWATCVTAWAGDPKVPAGQDPGGVAVALIGGGVDYTAPAIAPRLARDGEGELIGWDGVDNDHAPFAAADAPGNATEAATVLLSAYAKGRLVPVRVARGDAQGLAKAIAFVAGTPARIMAIALPLDSAPMRMVVRQASERFKDHLIVVADDGSMVAAAPSGATPQATPIPLPAPLPVIGNLGNVLIVTAGEVGKPEVAAQRGADLIVLPRGASMFGTVVANAPPRDQSEAVALAAAAAACQGHNREVPLVGSAAKAAVLDAAQPLAGAPQVRTLDPMWWYGASRF